MREVESVAVDFFFLTLRTFGICFPTARTPRKTIRLVRNSGSAHCFSISHLDTEGPDEPRGSRCLFPSGGRLAEFRSRIQELAAQADIHRRGVR